jgi:sulfide:quinone oxidoreductase
MKKLLILGVGTDGIIVANKMRKVLERDEWNNPLPISIGLIHYQSEFLFILFGMYNKNDVFKPKSDFLPVGVNVIYSKIDKVNTDNNSVLLDEGVALNYDYLIITTGTQIVPKKVNGLKGELWYKDIFDFYTIEEALTLDNYLKTWKSGKLVINIAELPFKCPIVPLEFVFCADAFFTERRMRDKVDITYVTSLLGAFIKSHATKMLGELLV